MAIFAIVQNESEQKTERANIDLRVIIWVRTTSCYRTSECYGSVRYVDMRRAFSKYTILIFTVGLLSEELRI